MTVTPSALRANLFKLLDQLLETGETLEVKRKGEIIKIVPPKRKSKLDSLKAHPDAIVGDPEELVHIDWSHEWKPFL
ncbi:MAG: type II toxin-antitoxin system Phd/YefM family antitoxin [Campylobacterota bacterium]|nr:type II toxin-antitoxin system Phd/YefM family antitoxin [Campylobacterota bacterium]